MQLSFSVTHGSSKNIGIYLLSLHLLLGRLNSSPRLFGSLLFYYLIGVENVCSLIYGITVVLGRLEPLFQGKQTVH